MVDGPSEQAHLANVTEDATSAQAGKQNQERKVGGCSSIGSNGTSKAASLSEAAAKRSREDSEESTEEHSKRKLIEVNDNEESREEGGDNKDTEKIQGSDAGGVIEPKLEPEEDKCSSIIDGKQDKKETAPLFTFGMSLSSSKEFVCPFSKLLENRKQGEFLSSSNNNSSPTDDVDGKAPVEEQVEPLTKAFEIKDSVMDDEHMLMEIKSCTMAYYKDGEWNTPVPVVLQLLEKKTKESKRIVCYQLGTGRLQLNTVLLPNMSVKPLKTKSVIFSGQLIADATQLLPHRIIFQDQSSRESFMKHF